MSDDHALRVLREALTRLRSQPRERERWDDKRTRAARDEALALYGEILSPERVGGLDRETFLGFLRSENRRHTMGLGRGLSITDDMPRLREALTLLVDQGVPLDVRLDRLRPRGGHPMVKGLGPSVITTILHLMDPARYGILNGTSEKVMRRLGLSPELPVSASFAERYAEFNQVLLRLADALAIDLGLLDALWWRVPPQHLTLAALPRTVSR